jgi:5-formyltetrahydrofolate cyclo-ligase
MHEEQNKLARKQFIELRKERQAQLAASPHFEKLLHSRILMAIEKIDTLYSININNIAFYWPIHGEFDLRIPLLEWQSRDSNRKLALPVTQNQQALKFCTWDDKTTMKKGFANIPEPCNEEFIQPDLIIAPCVGWFFANQQMWRIGYGGGYYDRTMDAYQKKNISPFLLGTALEISQTDHPIWQPQAHDYPLRALLTEASLYLQS